jgi:hypothetical protein
LTVATDELLLDQVTVRPTSTLPAASRGVASACVVAPGSSADCSNATETEATGEGTGVVTCSNAVPLLPSLLADIVADPAASVLTSPLLETVAIDPFDDE